MLAADGFVVQTGDPDGPAEGFVDPSTDKVRTIPLEIMVQGDKQPVYEATLEVTLETICLLYYFVSSMLHKLLITVIYFEFYRNWVDTRPRQGFPSTHLEHLQWQEK
jgi:hypothetical protein